MLTRPIVAMIACFLVALCVALYYLTGEWEALAFACIPLAGAIAALRGKGKLR